jgi:hypothetical protein
MRLSIVCNERPGISIAGEVGRLRAGAFVEAPVADEPGVVGVGAERKRTESDREKESDE